MGGSDSSGMSTTMVTVAVGAVITFLLWGVACSMFDASQGSGVSSAELQDALTSSDDVVPQSMGRRMKSGGVATFIATAFAGLPQMPQVIAYTFRERLWFVFVSIVVLAGVVLFGWMMKRTEASLNAGPRYRKR
jgi:hypothetical protein